MRKTLERSLGFLAVFSISVNRDFREAQKIAVMAAHTLFGIFTLQKAINFLSPDGSKVDICFVTVGPIDQRGIHLKIIGKIARLIRGTNLLVRLREAKNSPELVEVVTTLDREEPSMLNHRQNPGMQIHILRLMLPLNPKASVSSSGVL